jgi:uncharacterized membrane protein YphA (DoxX/SURF4 family)
MKRHLPAAARVILGGIFVYAAVGKIADPAGFAASVATYRILPYFPTYLVAATLPWLELFAGLLLVSGCKVKGGALVIAGLNLVFIAALASALLRGLDIDCGCFKTGGVKESPWSALVRDVVFLAMALRVLRWENAKQQSPG